MNIYLNHLITLKNIDYNARGVVDKNGNLYVLNNTGKTHDAILKILEDLGSLFQH